MGLREIASVMGWKKTEERKICLSEISCKQKPLSPESVPQESSSGGALSADAEKETLQCWVTQLLTFNSSFSLMPVCIIPSILRMQRKISAVAEWMLKCTKT